ncbi:MAG: 3-hydroxyacyl-CoA dehydrogenase NAD-binding domain-containing protein [Paracoccaceae bacterium]
MAGIETVAIVGSGLIGQSWAALFLAGGLRVVAQDVDPAAEAALRGAVAAAWPDLQALGLAEGAVPEARLSFTTDIAEACAGADFVQECGPDRIEVKQQIVAAIEAGAGAEVVIASDLVVVGERHSGRRAMPRPDRGGASVQPAASGAAGRAGAGAGNHDRGDGGGAGVL